MERFDLLRHVSGIIESMDVRYFVTGSTATIFYGEPRFTNDIDVVVDMAETQAVDFCRRFPQTDFYVSEDAARQAVAHHGQFNVIHPDSGLKADIIVAEGGAFNDSRFARRRHLHAGENLIAYFASPEDAIIKKLEYYQDGGSEKHIRDIAGVLKASHDQIDMKYISDWTRKMNLASVWAEVLARIDQQK